MHRVVEETADAGAAYAGCFGLQVEHLPDDAGFPVQPAVEPGAVLLQRRGVFGDHADRKRAVRCDLLATGYTLSSLSMVACLQQVKRQRLGTGLRLLPDKTRVHLRLQRGALCRVANQKIQARRQVTHAVDKDRQVDRRLPRQGCEGQLPRQQPLGDAMKRLPADAGHAVDVHRAAALTDDLTGGGEVMNGE